MTRAGRTAVVTEAPMPDERSLRPKAGMTAERPSSSCHDATEKKVVRGGNMVPPR